MVIDFNRKLGIVMGFDVFYMMGDYLMEIVCLGIYIGIVWWFKYMSIGFGFLLEFMVVNFLLFIRDFIFIVWIVVIFCKLWVFFLVLLVFFDILFVRIIMMCEVEWWLLWLFLNILLWMILRVLVVFVFDWRKMRFWILFKRWCWLW